MSGVKRQASGVPGLGAGKKTGGRIRRSAVVRSGGANGTAFDLAVLATADWRLPTTEQQCQLQYGGACSATTKKQGAPSRSPLRAHIQPVRTSTYRAHPHLPRP